ncbi:TonB-linked SusC/RagA family outer membrane protein [Pedobacter cryoconitis]|uniref:SusC/RagA family TonB-linked outer membrane protein n=1 Tax=Pedobacter cryoconitis TaxID=188932 RepID=UPI001611202F|nr:SusC/RagA family TonB-linked outer membrane protein [Pedobacter cryoconitis]MBB6271722.1 TonB-linked SusC/RagA family outer membrane protein [Pedobacter cryoconitis]
MIKFLRLFFLIGLLFNGFLASAQERNIKGILTDKKAGIAIPGATVRVKGKHQAGMTDKDGRFKMKVNAGEVLVFNYVGFETQEVTIQPNTDIINVSLIESSKSLTEVQITGAFGIRRKAKELGVATATITGNDVTQTQVVNPLNGLQSKVAGLQVNMFDGGVNPQVRVTLRGARNINDAKNEPLFVVDGVPLATVTYYNPQAGGTKRDASAISLINPNDIEDITVLKGASAASVYGSQGVNGVIIITTKRGKSGQGTINFSHATTLENVGWLPKLQDTYGSGFNGVYQPYEVRSWGPEYDGKMVKVGPVLPDGTQWELPYSPIKNQKSDFFNTGITNQENISFAGGDEKSTYFLSGQYVNNNGVIPKDQSKKTSLRFIGSRDFGKLKTSYSVNYVQTNTSTTTSEPWNNVRSIPSFIPLDALKDWQNTPYAKPEYYFSTTTLNPYWAIDNQRQDTKQENLTGNVSFDYQVAPWFKATYRVGLTSVNTGYKSFGNKFDDASIPYRYYGTDGNILTAVRKSTSFGGTSAGMVNDQTINNQQLNSDLLLQFNKDFGRFSTRLLLGQNYQDIQYKFVQVGAAALNFPDLYNESNLTGNLNGGSQITHQRRYSYFGEFTVGYNNYLFATLNGRRESVSLLSADNRNYFYPGANVSFILSQAIPALAHSNVLSFAKLYGSASKSGNVTVEPYALQNIYTSVDGFPFGNIPGAAINAQNLSNNLKPEFVYSYEGGIQLGFFKDRLHFEGTYAYADSRDQILDIGTSFASGFGSAKSNAARMKSKSIELTLNGDIIKTKDWSWSAGINYTHNDNTVVSLTGGQETLNQWKGLYLSVGDRYPTYQLPDYVRDPQGRVVINAATGLPSQASALTDKGTSQPVHMLGFNTSIRYKRLQLSTQIDARWGNMFYTAGAENITASGLLPKSAGEGFGRDKFIFPNSVIETSPGVYVENTSVQTNGDFAFWNTYKNILSNNVFNGRFIKLREIALNYDFPIQVLGHQKAIKGLHLSVYGRNLVNLRAKDNIFGETEFIYLSGVGFSGWRTTPSTRSYGFTLGLTI